MDSSELMDRLAELEQEAGRKDKRMFGKVIPVKVRVLVGNQVQVIDLEPTMFQLKSWGSEEDKNQVALIDLS